MREKINSPEVQERGWMLDNFPRTRTKQSPYGTRHHSGQIVFVNVQEDVLMSRLNRRIDPLSAISDLKVTRLLTRNQSVIKRDDDNEDAMLGD